MVLDGSSRHEKLFCDKIRSFSHALAFTFQPSNLPESRRFALPPHCKSPSTASDLNCMQLTTCKHSENTVARGGPASQ
eukprot:760257-Hanusia_phi.AAC.3